MRILVIGSGGREHALVWKLRQSPEVEAVLAAPGNGGTWGEGALNVPVAPDDVEGLAALVRREGIDMVVPGPELPLTLGVADRLRQEGIACFGPDAYAARLEGSKAFAKQMMERAHVPTARYAVFQDIAAASAYVRAAAGAPLAIKADGLAAGKGVVIARSEGEALHALQRMLVDRAFGAAGAQVLIEECLEGEEVSLLCLCDGTRAVPLPSAQDHKRVFDNDEGPNTGGMGAYSPAPLLPDDRLEELADLTVRPVVRELAREGHPFVGVLYAGLMMTDKGPKVLEYNVRFGDPECQPLLLRLRDDLPGLLRAAVRGELPPALHCDPRTAVGVVLTAKGYPGSYAKGLPVEGIAEAEAMPGVKVFHSGTEAREGGIFSNGGRVLCVTALGDGLAAAREAAYAAMAKVRMPQSFYRGDIGAKGLRRLAQARPEC